MAGAILAIFLFLSGPLIQLEERNEIKNVTAYEFYIDEENTLEISDILKINDWELIESSNPNFGINKYAIWLRFSVEKKEAIDKKFFVVNNSSLDEVNFFIVQDNKVVNKQVSGRTYSFYDRIIPTNKLIFEIGLNDFETADIYLKIVSIDKKILSAYIGNLQQVNSKLNFENILFGIFTGVIVGLFFYNIFLYLSVRDKLYLIYVIHTMFVWFAQASILGYTQELLWPDWTWMNLRSIVIFSSLVSIAGIWFLKVFLQTKKFVPKLNLGFLFVYFTYAFILANAIFFSITLSYQVLLVTQSIVVLYVLIVAVVVLAKGYRPARYYLLAWSVFMIGIFLFVLSEMGIIPFSTFTAYIMPLGSALEVVLLSFALADKINILKGEKEKEQTEKLKALKENEALILSQNINLEEKVKIRTEELEETLFNLQNTQTQLVNQEKMASLGQLTAGIAHEINNPINFVSSNISPLRRDITDLLEVVEKYRTLGKIEFSDQTKKEIDNLEEELELDYILTEIDQLLKGMEDGAKRTVEIVKGLRLFSRVDEQDVKKVDLHDGINSTLILLNSSMSGRIKVNREFEVIPLVECLAGKMNQVFMNIITNAIHALTDNLDINPNPEIIIRTKNLEDHVCIEIEDNGPGMPEHVKQRIFEPFFTTKAVGKGTGLGLSIVYTIIENHKGLLEVISSPGKGTKFVITLPIYQLTPQND